MTPNHLARCAAVLIALALLPAAATAAPTIGKLGLHQVCSNPPAPTGEPNTTTPAYDCYGVYNQGASGTCVGNEHHGASGYDENGTYEDKPSNGQMTCFSLPFGT